MLLPLSQLVYSKFRDVPGERRVLTLHRHNAFLDSMREIGLASNPDGAVIGLQSSKGVYNARSIIGDTWFVGPLHQPSPVHFGDAMQEIERFLWDEVDRQSDQKAVLPFLVGDEQGAIMSLAMAGAVPDLLSGVVAINATLPIVPGWEPPLVPLEGLPVLLVNPLDPHPLVGTLEHWGATVSSLSTGDGTVPLDDISAWIGSTPVRRRIRKAS